ncbi:hypothetical protein D3C80_2030280 [compost metagenome]
MRGSEQSGQQFGGHRTAAEVTHVTALGNSPVHRRTFLRTEGLVAHGRNSAATAWGLEGK